MAGEDQNVGSLIWNTSPQVYNSLKQSNASNDTIRRAAVASRLYNQHLRFTELPTAEARTLFSQLPEAERLDIIDFMGEQPYSAAKRTTWDKIKEAGGISFGNVINAFDKYARTQTNWYRANNLRKYQESIDPVFQAQNEATVARARQAPTISSAFLARRELDLRLFSRDQWDTTYQGEQYFDAQKEKDVELKYSPAVARVAKLYSMQKTPQEIMTLLKTPEEEQAFIAYNDPENGKNSEVFQAVIDYDNAKVSPGRDLAYPLRAYDKKSKIPDRYDIVSGLTDAAFLITTDPLIIGSKISSSLKVARFGLAKLAGASGESLAQGLDKMFRATSVRNYWNNAGAKIQQYTKTRDLATRGQIARDLARDFGIDVSKKATPDGLTPVDFVSQLAKAGVKDADSALNYFKQGGITELMLMGRTAGAVEPLMPRKTIASSIGNNLRNATATLMGLRTAREVPREWNNARALAQNFATPQDLSNYRTVAGNFNKVFSKIASGKPIRLDTAESAEDVFRLARLVVDPYFANTIKQAWREGDEATRLTLFDGLALNIGKKFGLSDEKVKELYGRTGRQLYSEDMTMLSKKSTALGKATSLGRRAGLTDTQLATTAAVSKGALADLNKQLKDARETSKGLKTRLTELKTAGASQLEIDDLQKQIDDINKKIGGIVKQSKFYRDATGDTAVRSIRNAMLRNNITPEEADFYIDTLRRGAQEEVDELGEFQFEQILNTVYDVIQGDPKLVKQLSKAVDGFDVLDIDLVDDFVRKAFPNAKEIAERLGQTPVNPAQLGDAQYAVGYWQLSNEVSLPNFAEWSREANSRLVGITRVLGERVVNGWSWLTLVPRLGIRSAIEEVGLFGIAVPLGDLHKLIIGKRISTEYRYAKYGPEALGFINRNLYRLFRSGDARISPAQRKLIQDNPDLLPQIIAKNVAKSKAVMVLSGFEPKTVERWVDDWFTGPFGYAALDDINEGALRALNLGESRIDETVSNMQKRYGAISQWNLRVKDALKDLKATKEFDSIRTGEAGFDLAWLNAIQMRVDHRTNLGWGKIVLANIYNQERAVEKLVENFAKNPQVMNKFVLYKSLGPEEFARRMYQFVAHPFTKRNGLLNDQLIAKVRKTSIDPATDKPRMEIDASGLTFKDLNEFDFNARPETVLGNRYIPATSGDKLIEYFKRGQDGAMNWMGKQISVLGREPALFANYQVFRKRLITAENDMVARYVDQGFDQATAEAMASRWAGNIAQELATTRTLQYLDNPTVRTNLAFNMRNLARYYRATEDFYRRIGRLVRFDPLAIAKLRLTMTGLEHTGFIHRDENGELYFVYPGDEIIYSAVGMGMRLTGNENALRQPQPAQFTARVSMLTPSLDPEAALPTLSGPISAIGIAFIERFLPDSEKSAFRKRILGKYSTNRTLPELLLPTSVSRVMNMFNSDEKASQWASAVRKAHMYYAANGIMKEFVDKQVAGGEEWSAAYLKYTQYVEATARNIVVARNLLGLFAPASPQVDFGLDVPEWVREQVDVVNLKPKFQELVRQYGNDPQAVDKALYKWSRLYPGKAVYALTESEKTGVGTVKSTMEAVNWVKDNQNLVKKYPEAVRFIVPTNGKYDLEAYAFLQDQGFTEMKDVEKFAFEAVVAEDYFYWRQVKNFQDDKIANAASPAEKRALQAQWEAWSKEYRAENPHVQVYLDNMVRNDTVKKETIEELYSMYRKGDMPGTESNKKIIEMVKIYNEFVSTISSVSGRTDEEVAFRRNLRKDTLDYMLQLASGDEQALAAYRTLFDPLIGE